MRVVKGTPIHGESKCLSCQNAMVIQGYAETQQQIVCTYARSRLMPFPVASCSCYEQKNTLDLHAMMQMAYILESKEGKYGFRRPTEAEISRSW